MAFSSTSTIPEGLDVLNTSDGLIIRKRWLSWTVFPLALFCVVWDSFLLFFYTMLLRSPHPHWPILLFPVGHLAVGIFLTYSVFTTLFNKTDVRLSSAGVQVSKGPLPWPGNKAVEVGEINEVLVRARSGNRGASTYSIMYADRERRERPLLTGVAQSDQAEFIASTTRQRLGLREPTT